MHKKIFCSKFYYQKQQLSMVNGVCWMNVVKLKWPALLVFGLGSLKTINQCRCRCRRYMLFSQKSYFCYRQKWIVNSFEWILSVLVRSFLSASNYSEFENWPNTRCELVQIHAVATIVVPMLYTSNGGIKSRYQISESILHYIVQRLLQLSPLLDLARKWVSYNTHVNVLLDRRRSCQIIPHRTVVCTGFTL